jgi:hypothetical protein
MKHRLVAISWVVALLACGCGGGGGGAVDARGSYDAANRTDRVYVIKQVTLPATQEDVNASKFEMPGSGFPVNKLGALLQVMMDMLEGVPVQADLDANYLAGEALQVMIVRSGGLTGVDDGVTGYYAEVDDADDPANAANNWAGEGEFTQRGDTHKMIWTTGVIDNGELVASGDASILFTFLLPMFTGETPTGSEGCFPVVRATITEDSLIGAAGNAVTPEEFEASVLPLAARLLTQAIVEDKPKKSQIKAMFDENDDDEVTALELAESDLMATLGMPDVDIDGDDILDHLSQGILFEAVRADLLSE